ncbi:MAG: hypothetical protein EOO27_38355 [Comamonadaceae bacterium]|nr:MAG: hypothetical protein EOO27_38355 [Comamonadaceae bacterium]
MLFEDIKLVVYVSKSTRGRWPPGPAFVKGARPMAIRLGVTGALLDDGLGILHVVEGASKAVDQFMAFVSHYNGLNSTRVLHEGKRSSRMFKGIAMTKG